MAAEEAQGGGGGGGLRAGRGGGGGYGWKGCVKHWPHLEETVELVSLYLYLFI